MFTDTPNGLLTDLYQLTMASGYHHHQMADRQAVFHLTFRRAPFGGSFAIANGLASAVRWLQEFRFTDGDLGYLAGLLGADGKSLFGPSFLQYLSETKFRCDVDAVPEGTVVFPHEPLVRVRGPLAQAQIVETALLTMVNFETLVATKAARICRAAAGDPVLEFGLRRAQGVNGGLAASRAAYVGGCSATSNVWAGRQFGIPIKGTHAHSWVMTFDGELEAFEAYAAAMPNNCVLLVDTYGTIPGVRNAITVARNLVERGGKFLGIRLDSGDLTDLSRAARQMLDEAGFSDARIVASNDLDEYEIERLKESGAKIDTWGVGTRLATCYEQPALGGVYKLAAIQDEAGKWHNKIKLSDEPIKVSLPGVLQIRRYHDERRHYLGDVIYDERKGPHDEVHWSAWTPAAARPQVALDQSFDLLQPIMRNGELVQELPDAHEARELAMSEQKRLDSGLLRNDAPLSYPVGLDREVFQERERLMV